MGFHICEYDHSAPSAFEETSSGDVTLVFGSGRSWEMPDMITHYIVDHGYCPPSDFVSDVMMSIFVSGERLQTKSPALRVGYLEGDFPMGKVPERFVFKLMALMRLAEKNGLRRQTRSAT